MRFDGMNFRRVRTIVPITLTEERIDALVANGTFAHAPYSSAYMVPGKVAKKTARGAVLVPGWTMDGEPVYAVPMKVTGWSLTNMVYVTDHGKSRVILFYSGGVYSAA
jgi:hypothetical protein